MTIPDHETQGNGSAEGVADQNRLRNSKSLQDLFHPLHIGGYILLSGPVGLSVAGQVERQHPASGVRLQRDPVADGGSVEPDLRLRKRLRARPSPAASVEFVQHRAAPVALLGRRRGAEEADAEGDLEAEEEAIEPGDFTDQPIMQYGDYAAGPSSGFEDDEASEGDEVFVPPTDPVGTDREVIGGLGLLHAVEVTHRPAKAAEHAPRLKQIYDQILARGCTEDGMMYNGLDQGEGQLSDGWGYNYVGYLCYDLATGTNTYRPQVEHTLRNTMKPLYENYAWEGESIDGYADSIEGALYLLNRVPVAEGFAWVDRETKNNLVDHPSRLENGELWGTMKLQSNGVRTVLIHSLMHTRGVIARPWQQGLELGAAPHGGGIAIVVRAQETYRGVLEFDLPRHRVYLGFQNDWPRMNTIPEWFTVEPERRYVVNRVDTGAQSVYTGRQLHCGLAIAVEPGETVRLTVAPAP